MIKQYWKQLIILAALITCCSVAARMLTGGETLSDYASDNPSLAYAVANSSEASTESNASASKASTSHTADSYASYSNASASKASGSKASASEVSTTSSDGETISAFSDSITEKQETKVTTYKKGFYYEEIPQNVLSRIYGSSYPADASIPLSSLRYCVINYVNFENETSKGELICNKELADDMMEIFYELYVNGYQLESVRLVDDFGADDELSMESNNTSCFNYRNIAGTSRLSKHSLGAAIDINPLYNPYITYNDDGTTKFTPTNAAEYTDRSRDFPYKIDDNDLAYKLFTEHGYTWGGHWNNRKDYQHFEKNVES